MSPGTGRRRGRLARAMLFAAGLAALAAPALAQGAAGSGADQTSAPIDPERLALAREYVQESHMDAVMRGAFANMAKSLPQKAADSATGAKTRQFMNSVSVGMDATVPQLVEATTQATARVFTTQELKDLVAFYRTSSGQSMVAKMPLLMQQMTVGIFQIMPTVYQAAETDYCSHVTCTEADHTRFRQLQSNLSHAAGSPPGAQ